MNASAGKVSFQLLTYEGEKYLSYVYTNGGETSRFGTYQLLETNSEVFQIVHEITF